MKYRVIIWDNDGTIVGSRNPCDRGDQPNRFLPNVERIMRVPNTLNILCSGCKTTESERQNFDPDMIINKFSKMMSILPLSFATFSPTAGGTQCYVIFKKAHTKGVEIHKAHEDPRYKEYIGLFKKPKLGMTVVIKDILKEIGYTGAPIDIIFIGDTWHDQEAAYGAGFTFLYANMIHTMSEKNTLDNLLMLQPTTIQQHIPTQL
jgi:hypothetical protein